MTDQKKYAKPDEVQKGTWVHFLALLSFWPRERSEAVQASIKDVYTFPSQTTRKRKISVKNYVRNLLMPRALRAATWKQRFLIVT